MALSPALSRPSLMLLSAAALVGVVVLVGLGTWQLQRLSWKEALIERIATRLDAAPVELEAALKRQAAGEDVNFLKVKLRGTYDHSKAQYFYTLKKGQLGWRALTPLSPETGGAPVLIDRGFLPDAEKPLPAQTGAEPVEVVGALRFDYLSQELFTPDNNPGTNSWYWFDLPALQQATGLTGLRPMVVQLDTSDHSGPWPAAAALSPNLSNKHFGYALTWFGLAITLLGVYIALIVQERRKRSSL